jgi:hypothetical protein
MNWLTPAEWQAALPMLQCALAAFVVTVIVAIVQAWRDWREDSRWLKALERPLSTPTCCDRCREQQVDPSTVALFAPPKGLTFTPRSAYRVH